MPIELTEQEIRQRVVKLIDQLNATLRTIEEVDIRIQGIPMVYTRSQYGSKVKAVRATVMSEYVKERKTLIQKQENLVSQIEEYQKKLSKPIVTFDRK